MEDDWKAAFLPAGYLDNNHDDLVLVDKFIRELLKYEKSDMAKLVSVDRSRFHYHHFKYVNSQTPHVDHVGGKERRPNKHRCRADP
jgi:hypothetical protein